MAKDELIEKLTRATVDCMKTGAGEYVVAHQIEPTEAQLYRLYTEMADRATAAMEEGLRDFNKAMSANMTQVAVATFAATMKLAGIDAAKAVFGPA
jgi:hypothetical protein